LEELKEFGCENQQDCIADIDFHISGSEAKRQLALLPSFYQTVDTGTITKSPLPNHNHFFFSSLFFSIQKSYNQKFLFAIIH